MVINEVLSTARSLPPHTRYPTYLFLDEFQRFVGLDVVAAIPEVRQLIYKVLRAGGSRADAAADAAAKAKVSHQTINSEARRDPTFLQGLIDTEIDGKLSLLVTVRECAKAGDWKAAAWMLERKYWVAVRPTFQLPTKFPVSHPTSPD